ncbi:MAG: co-chaperone GroES [Candidatus Nomurabacteria bacterium]|nr:co-chaperone GroES [Candidatus Nomurabacteria bacterium]
MLKPLKDRVVARKETAATKTASGLLLGEATEKPAYAVVEAVGAEAKTVKKGDKIVFKEYTATEIKVDGVEYLIIKEDDVLGVIA